MISVCFFKKGGSFRGFSIKGHSGYAGSGSDIVCAGISSMASMTVTCIEEAGTKYSFTSDEAIPEAVMNTEEVSEISDTVLRGFYREALSVSEQYPKNVSVTTREIK